MNLEDLDKDLQTKVALAIQSGVPMNQALQRAQTVQASRTKPTGAEKMQASSNAQRGIIKTMLTPFERVGRSAGGALFEMARAGANPEIVEQDQNILQKSLTPANKVYAQLGKLLGADLRYTDEQGNTIENPFLNEQSLQTITDRPVTEAAKTTAGVMSYAIPFGKGSNFMTKAVIPGMASGGLFEAGMPGSDLESVERASITGGVTAGVLQGLGNAFKAVKGGGGRFQEATRKGVINPQVESGPRSAAIEKKIMNKLEDIIGPVKSSQEAREKIALAYDDLGTQLGNILDEYKEPISLDEVMTSITKKLEDTASIPSTPTERREFNQVLRSLFQGQADDLTANQLAQTKEVAADLVPWNKYDATGRLKSESNLTFKQDIAKKVYDSLNRILKIKVKKATPILAEMQTLHQASPGLQKAAETAGLQLPLGLSPKVKSLGEPSQRLSRFIGDVVGGASRISPAGVADNPLLQKALSIASGQVGREPSAVPQMPETLVAPTGEQTSTNPYGITPELLARARLELPSSEYNKLQDVYDMFSEGEGDLPQEVQTAMSTVDSLQNLYGEVQAQGLTAQEGGIPGRVAGAVKGKAAAITQSSPEAATYEATKEAFLSQIIRGLGEKGTLNDKDIERIRKAIPGFSDSPEKAAQSWNIIREVLRKAGGGEQSISISDLQVLAGQ